MGWSNFMDVEIICDECDECENECTEHEQPCDTCGVVSCVCDNMYEAWQEEQW